MLQKYYSVAEVYLFLTTIIGIAILMVLYMLVFAMSPGSEELKAIFVSELSLILLVYGIYMTKELTKAHRKIKLPF